MARNGSGTFSLAEAAFVTGTTIDADDVNSDLSDIATALTASIAKDGQTTPTANLPMGSFKHTGVADGSARTDYASLGQVAKGTLFYAADTGAADVYAVAPSPGITANVVGFSVDWKVTNTNLTTTPTLAASGLTAGTIVHPDATALDIGELVAGAMVTTKIVSLSGTTPTWHLMTVTKPVSASNTKTLTNKTINVTGNTIYAALRPMGRLTLSTAVPVMTSNVTAATSIYYTPYCGNLVPIYDGTGFVWTVFTELTNTTTDATKNPAAVTTNSNYDLFVWSDSGTIRLGRGPAWTSDTGRGTGAGTTELERVGGLLLNKIAISNGPAANRGTYVGTVRSDGSSQINWHLGAVAASGTAAILGVWNAFNRAWVRGLVGDSTNSWAYLLTTIRAANNSATMRVSFLQGLAEDFFTADYQSLWNDGTSQGYAGIGYNVTDAFSGRIGYLPNSGVTTAANGAHSVQQLGWGFMSACEAGSNSGGTGTWYGDNNTPTINQTGLTFQGMF